MGRYTPKKQLLVNRTSIEWCRELALEKERLCLDQQSLNTL